MSVAPPRLKRCRRRPLGILLAGLAALLALTFLAGGGHEELLSRALPLLLPPPAGNAPPAPAPPSAFQLSPPPCAAPAPWLLVLVASAPGHAARRAAVRRSWGAARLGGGRGLRVLFALGLPAEAGLQAALEREAAEHGDLLQGRFADTYGNLTLKTLALLGWAAARCPAARFLLKADDDVYLNLPGLARELDRLGGPPDAAAYLGRVHWHVAPTRDPRSRHYVPARLYPEAAFPPYCSGTAYALSAPAAGAVLAAARHLPLVPLEDAFVGLCARRAGIAPRHLARLAGSARFPPDACCYREVLFSAHRVTAAEMLAVAAAPEPSCTAWQRLLGLVRCKLLSWLSSEPDDP
ncbi:beta-1,3-galactosyltransferase 4-like [Crotalus tigris]|uniref:beta-1,3-galactosyltransferase 4-like n=1 Tax=Crotalus tigris TaxID=88082 RepID=UPI00192F7247|nr:beta-1,3-galactosyltransferase 4-like [Crotalus tigris]